MSPPPKRGRAARALIGVPLAGLLLAGCGAVNEAVSQGQQALDSARSAVEAAQGLLDAGAQLGAACAAAQAAWVPGVSADEALMGMSRETLQTACALVSLGG